MLFGQVMTIFKVNPDPDPHFRFLCEHGARNPKEKEENVPHTILQNVYDFFNISKLTKR